MKPYPEYKDSGVEWIGVIPKEWDTFLFKRIITQIKDGTHGTFERTEEGHPLLSAKNVFNSGIFIGNSESQISEKDYNDIVKNGFPEKGDLLITCVGTIGRTYVYNLDRPFAFQRSVAFLRLNEKCHPQFFYYFVQSNLYSEQLVSYAKTSAQSGVYMSDILNTITIYCSLPEQKQITQYLDHKTAQIDTLIERKKG